jgi:hypothetical protein
MQLFGVLFIAIYLLADIRRFEAAILLGLRVHILAVLMKTELSGEP